MLGDFIDWVEACVATGMRAENAFSSSVLLPIFTSVHLGDLKGLQWLAGRLIMQASLVHETLFRGFALAGGGGSGAWDGA